MFKYTSNFYFHNGLKIKVENDLLRYMLWHVYKSPYDTLGQMIPFYGAHISVVLPLHGVDKVKGSKKYDGQPVDFFYGCDIRKGGNKIINGKQHINYWLKLECHKAEVIKRDLNIIEDNFLGFHMTISTNKNFIKQ